ncbi:GNAT family N-acetyltransferase [Massilia sp. IC2-476]|uniref:GNAT family N-acetyltransferase n=1 Tax=Massilia sp. IC2-476 TaxID=2887199 RepID=UPI001D0F6310|nr:GNAT family N-acetyltransferase [Massilia sp. IC2-476]MCC2972183.1 GNAT family N-acetyltransferase [Massilia sp. IC2-476]
MRVDTASIEETCRYVFAGPAPGLVALAASIRAPRTFIKMCGRGEELLALAPPGWELQPGGYLMTHAGQDRAPPPLAPGYRLELRQEGPAILARIHAEDGALAASGYAAEYGGAFVFDRIATYAAHRRRGLGSAMIAALAARQRSPAARRVLVATEDGRALYAALGWRVASPYSTIVIPDDVQ